MSEKNFTDIGSTSHSQAREIAAAFGAAPDNAALVAELADTKRDMQALQAELDAEKDAHAKTTAALNAATAAQ